MYERLVAAAAGPLSALVGLGATAIVHQNVSHATALNVATFALSAGASALGHWRWLANVPKWWEHLRSEAVYTDSGNDSPVI